jgi:hypothetical protein
MQKIYRRYDPSTDDLNPSLTVGDLINILTTLDPNMKIGLRGSSGAEVRSIGEIDVDELHVASSDHSYATRGLYRKSFGKIKFDNLGDAVFID